MHSKPHAAVPLICIGYTLLLVRLASILPLWLDEVLQLIGTCKQHVHEILYYLTSNPGAAPLSYLVQALFLRLFGFSLFSARLSSIVSSALACVIVYALARRLTPRASLLALLAFIVLPLQFRYALEARPYSQALMLSALSTLLLVELEAKPTIALAAYCASAASALYSQPFSFFVPVSHSLWAAYRAGMSVRVVREFAFEKATLAATGAAGLLFLPWFLYVRAEWRTAVSAIAAEGEGFRINSGTFLMLLREFSGASYWGSSILLIAVCLGMFSPAISLRTKSLLSLTVVLPIICVLIADAIFDYFIAIRPLLSKTILNQRGAVAALAG